MTEAESPEIRLRRMRMRSWRRGMKEMDLILGPFADGPLAALGACQLDLYEVVLDQNDQDLYRWITARLNDRAEGTGPEDISTILDTIAHHASGRVSALRSGRPE